MGIRSEVIAAVDTGGYFVDRFAVTIAEGIRSGVIADVDTW
jgi:hypothetical protein